MNFYPTLCHKEWFTKLLDTAKSVENVAKTYRECGIKDLSLKLYEKDRHEILNELDRQTVYEDILAWVEAHLI